MSDSQREELKKSSRKEKDELLALLLEDRATFEAERKAMLESHVYATCTKCNGPISKAVYEDPEGVCPGCGCETAVKISYD